MQFHALKYLFLSSAPWKTTKKTYISIIRQIWKNSPEKGCFLALNVPGGRKPEFCQSLWQWFYIWYNCLHTLTEFQKKTMDGSNVMRQKVSFLAILGHFGAFLAIKEPLGTQRELFSKIRECYIPPIWSCNSMQNFRKIQWIVIENFPDGRTHTRTHARTRENSKVPIPT